jgi:glycosyltransferase involved in cell wall biosynthesis
VSGVSIYLDGFPFTYRARNSDWTYVERKMPRVAKWAPDIRFVLQKSRIVALRANYKAVRAAIGRRIGMPMDLWVANTDYLDAAELGRSGCNMIFSHRGFPLNSGDIPVIWMNAIVDPEMTKSYFKLSDTAIEEEVEVKGRLFHRATVVQVCTEAEAERHARTFPDIANRFVHVPLFIPHLRAAPGNIIEKHRKAAPVRLLFVGNDAKCKGLQETLSAYASLPEMVRRGTSFTIVSHFDRGKIAIPNDPRITVHRGLPQADVIEHMRAAHILVNVSHFESYGNVFLEAMSQGVLCVGPDWEVQRELFNNGRAGMNVRCEVSLVRSAMLRAIEDEEYRIALASAGWQRFNEQYAPAVVASKYANLFRAVAAGNYKNGSRS